MKKLFLLLVTLVISLLVISLVSIQPALAQDGAPTCSIPTCVYVNSTRQPTGNEDGTSGSPYTEFKEGKAYAQSLPGGGWLYFRNPTTGQWERTYVPEALPGGLGAPLPNATLYVLLGVLALILILFGRQLQRRARQPRG